MSAGEVVGYIYSIIDLKESHSTKTNYKLPYKFSKYQDIFLEEKADQLSKYGPADLTIKTINNKAPPFRPLYNLSTKELKVLRDYIHTNLLRGWI